MKSANEHLQQDSNYLRNMLKRAREGKIRTDSEEGGKGGVIIPNATQVPNEVFDEYLPYLKESELKVLLYLIRKTFGYSKPQGDYIALSQILTGTKKKNGEIQDCGTGLSRKTAMKALRTLERAGLIKVRRGRDSEGLKKTNFYRLRTRKSY